jgi:hypothetical protein
MKLPARAPARGSGGRQRMHHKEGNPEVAAERRGGAGGSSAARTCGDRERGTVGGVDFGRAWMNCLVREEEDAEPRLPVLTDDEEVVRPSIRDEWRRCKSGEGEQAYVMYRDPLVPGGTTNQD